jgi:uncharacterized protein YbaR (Trm112 family)
MLSKLILLSPTVYTAKHAISNVPKKMLFGHPPKGVVDLNTLCVEVSMNPKMFDILCCPVCHGDVVLSDHEIACVKCQLRYPIEDGIPVMLVERARKPS